MNPAFTVRIAGWTDDESRPLLEHLYGVAAREDHTCRFRWEAGSVAFWGQSPPPGTQAPNDYPGERRLMHRVTVEGETLAPYRTE